MLQRRRSERLSAAQPQDDFGDAKIEYADDEVAAPAAPASTSLPRGSQRAPQRRTPPSVPLGSASHGSAPAPTAAAAAAAAQGSENIDDIAGRRDVDGQTERFWFSEIRFTMCTIDAAGEWRALPPGPPDVPEKANPRVFFLHTRLVGEELKLALMDGQLCWRHSSEPSAPCCVRVLADGVAWQRTCAR
jgi:hypothetical protein